MLRFVALAPSPDWLTDAVRPVLITQAVLGTIALIGLVAVLRRFLSTEFPAAMLNVNNRLDTLHHDFESLERQFNLSLLEVAKLSVRVDNLEKHRDRLDDTWGGIERRRPPRT